MSMKPPTIFYFGHVSLLRPSSTTPTPIAKRSLNTPTLSFGRDPACDVQIALEVCSRKHMSIQVQEVEPYNAHLQVHSINGVHVNGKRFVKGAVVALSDGDIIDLCGRKWLWNEWSTEQVLLNTPAAKRTFLPSFSPFHSTNSTTSRAAVAVPPSPFKPSTTNESLNTWDNGQDRQEGEDLIVWEDEEEEVFPEETAETQEEEKDSFNNAFGPTVPATPGLANRPRSLRAPLSAMKSSSTSHTSTPKRRLTIIPADMVPSWNKKKEQEQAAKEAVELARVAAKTFSPVNSPAKSSISPAPEQVIGQHGPTTSSPFAHKSSPAISSSPSPLPSGTPQRRRSSIASPQSSTSRRISALLIPASAGGGGGKGKSFGVPDDSFESEESESSSDEDGEKEEEEQGGVEEEDVPIHLPFFGSPSPAVHVAQPDVEGTPILFTSPRDSHEMVMDTEDVIMADAEEDGGQDLVDQGEEERHLRFAASVPLPVSPAVGYTSSHTPSSSPSNNLSIPQSLSSPSPSPRPKQRRHSLREKVLIRGAIRASFSSPQISLLSGSPSPTPTPSPSSPGAEVQENEQGQEELQEEQKLPQQPALPRSLSLPAISLRSPAKPRDSIELAHERSSPIKGDELRLLEEDEEEEEEEEPDVDAEGEDDLDLEENEEEWQQQDNAVSVPLDSGKSPIRLQFEQVPTPPRMVIPQTPPSRNRPRDSVMLTKDHLAHAASIPLPVTPEGTMPWILGTPKPATPVALVEEDDDEEEKQERNGLPSTPATSFARQSRKSSVQKAQHATIADALHSFQRDMMSPINYHRIAKTPKSAMRKPANFNSRRKSIRGFLSPILPRPTTGRKAVAWDTKLYVQPIFPVRTLSDEGFFGDLALAANVPLPASPDPREELESINGFFDQDESASPIASTSAISPSQRPTGRTLTETPSVVVQHAKGVSADATPIKRSATRVHLEIPIFAPPASPSPSSSFLLNGNGEPSREEQAMALFGTPKSISRSQSAGVHRPSLADLLVSPAPRLGIFRTPKSKQEAYLARIEAQRRKSMPAQVAAAGRSSSVPKVATPPPAEKGKEAFAAPTADKVSTSLPAAQVQPIVSVTATPNLASGLHRLFAPPPVTPNFEGVSALFQPPVFEAAIPHLQPLPADDVPPPVKILAKETPSVEGRPPIKMEPARHDTSSSFIATPKPVKETQAESEVLEKSAVVTRPSSLTQSEEQKSEETAPVPARRTRGRSTTTKAPAKSSGIPTRTSRRMAEKGATEGEADEALNLASAAVPKSRRSKSIGKKAKEAANEEVPQVPTVAKRGKAKSKEATEPGGVVESVLSTPAVVEEKTETVDHPPPPPALPPAASRTKRVSKKEESAIPKKATIAKRTKASTSSNIAVREDDPSETPSASTTSASGTSSSTVVSKPSIAGGKRILQPSTPQGSDAESESPKAKSKATLPSLTNAKGKAKVVKDKEATMVKENSATSSVPGGKRATKRIEPTTAAPVTTGRTLRSRR